MTQSIIVSYFTAGSVYPSNAQIWHAGKDSFGDFSYAELKKIFFGNTPAPKGHFVYNAFNRDRNAVSGLSNVTTVDDVDKTRPTTIAFFAGRAWYSGVNSKNSAGNVYYSQIFIDNKNVGKCHQEQDPTAEIFNALLDTDGGVIPITGAGNIISLQVISLGVVAVADNGVWIIQGGSNGFTATSFSVRQISINGAISRGSIVKAGDRIFFWGRSAIYEISVSDRGVIGTADITTGLISETYKIIKTTSKINARAAYNSTDKKVFFLYNEDLTYDGSSFKNKYNKVLVLDTALNIFYDQSIGELAVDSPFITGLFETSKTTAITRTENVTVGGVDVTVGGVVVTSTVKFPTDNAITSKAITLVPNGLNYNVTFSEFYRDDFRDWLTKDGVGISKPAYVETSPETLNVPQNNKKATSVVAHFKVTEAGFTVNTDTTLSFKSPSGCFMEAHWDWSDNATSGRFGRKQQIYRFGRHYIPTSPSDVFSMGQYVLTSKTSIRGSGRSLSLRFESDGDKDFNLLGWTTNFTVDV